jgi:hypothetical protein
MMKFSGSLKVYVRTAQGANALFHQVVDLHHFVMSPLAQRLQRQSEFAVRRRNSWTRSPTGSRLLGPHPEGE